MLLYKNKGLLSIMFKPDYYSRYRESVDNVSIL
jgi:hypothetical protein